MSGSRNIVLTLSTAGAEKVRADLEALGPAGEAALKRLDDAVQRSSRGMATASAGASTLRQNLGGLGLQLQDVAVQAQMGTNALTILGQQGPQIASLFGPAGMIAGAAITMGAFAAQLGIAALTGKELADVFKEIDASSRLADEAAKRRVSGLEEEANRLNALAAAYREYNAQALAGERARLSSERSQNDRSARSRLGSVDAGIFGIGSVRGAAQAAASGAGEAPSGQEQAALDQLTALNDIASITRERVLAVAGALDEAARANGPFSSSLGAVRDELLKQIGPLTEAGDKARANAEQLRLIEQASGGAATGVATVGTAAGTTAGQVGGLNTALDATRQRLMALAQQRVANPFEDVEESLKRLRAQQEALQRGGTQAFTEEQRRQTAQAQIASRVEQDVAKLEKALKDANVGGAEATQRLAAARTEAVRLRTEEATAQAALANQVDAVRQREADARKEATAGRAAARREDAEAAKERLAAIDLERRIYAELQMTRSGLLAVTSSDERGMNEAERVLRAAGQHPDQVKKRTDEATRIATQAYESQQRKAEATYERITDYAGNAFADLFLDTEGGWKRTMDNLERVAIATFAKIAFEAAARPIIMPMVQQFVGSTGGGAMGGAGAVFSTAAAAGAGATPVTDAQGNIVGYAQNAYAGKTLGGLFDGGMGMMSPGYSFQSGYVASADRFIGSTPGGGIGGFLDKPVYGATEGAMYGPYSAASPGTGFTVSGGGVNSLTYGQAALGGLSVAGGAFGIYQGIQQGGPKGAANVVGGAAGVIGGGAGLAAGSAGALGIGAGATAALGAVAAVAPYVAVIAAIVAMMLPAQKPSDRTGTSFVNLSTNETTEGGLGGDRFSQENRDSAMNVGRAIQDLADKIGSTYGITANGAMLVSAGSRDGLVLRNGSTDYDFSHDEAGVADLLKQATRIILETNGGQLTGSLATTYATVGTGDPDRLLEALDWTKTVYDAFAQAEDQASQYAQQVKGLWDEWGPLIERAREYGLAVEPIQDRLGEMLGALNDARSLQFNQIVAGFDFTSAQLRGDPDTVLRMQLTQFDLQRTADYTAMAEQIKQMGFGAEQIEVATRAFDEMKDLQRQSVIEQTEAAKAQQAAAAAQEASTRLSAEASALQTLSQQGGILQSFLDDQATSGATSPQSAFLAAQSQYAEALERARASSAETADLGRVTGAAQNLLSASSAFYGDGAQGAMIRSGVLGQVKSLGVDLGLPQFSDRFEDNVTRLITSQTDQVAANQALAEEIRILREEFRTYRLRNAA
jgi:hypothetical protein